MRPLGVLRQLLSFVLCALLTGPSYASKETPTTIQLHNQPNGAVYQKTRIWTVNVRVTYDYDAFGNLLHSSTTLSSPTPNEFLFAGEQFDSDLGLYYNRARYLSTSIDRFWTIDSFEGTGADPLSLHKYLYSRGDPINRIDPSGNQDTLVEEEEAEAGNIIVQTGTTVGPQVAATAPTVAESVAVAAELKTSLINVILFGITVGTCVSLEGDNQPGPRANPRNNNDSANRGSLQVQGEDIATQGGFDLTGHPDFTAGGNTVAWPWNRSTPLLAQEALTKLSEFLQILTPAQIGRRGKAFKDASRFIVNASLGGGVIAPVHQPFNANDPKFPDARVDIVVNAGRAFVP